MKAQVNWVGQPALRGQEGYRAVLEDGTSLGVLFDHQFPEFGWSASIKRVGLNVEMLGYNIPTIEEAKDLCIRRIIQ